jgi:hypothetical protein
MTQNQSADNTRPLSMDYKIRTASMSSHNVNHHHRRSTKEMSLSEILRDEDRMELGELEEWGKDEIDIEAKVEAPISSEVDPIPHRSEI